MEGQEGGYVENSLPLCLMFSSEIETIHVSSHMLGYSLLLVSFYVFLILLVSNFVVEV